MKIILSLVILASLFAVGFAANTRNIFFGDLAATLVGNTIQLLPLNINDPNQQWNLDGGYIVSVAKPNLVFDVKDSSKVGGTRLIAYNKKLTSPGNLNQLWNIYPNGTIESRLATGFFLGPDTDMESDFFEVDYNTPMNARVSPPINPYVCTSYGDPHITRFKPCTPLLEAQEGGTFALARFGNVRVSATHSACGARAGIFCNSKTNVMVGTNPNLNRVEVVEDTVRINGQLVTVTDTTVISAGFNITRVGRGQYVINFPTGVVTVTNPGVSRGVAFQNIKIQATSGPVPDGGLCHCRDGPNLSPVARKRQTLPPRQFVHSWKYMTICEDPFYYPTPADYQIANPPTTPSSGGNLTTDNVNLRNNATLLCAALLTGPLVTQCSPHLDPAGFYQNCLDDVIGTEDLTFAAAVIDTYVDHCSELATITPPTSAYRTIAFGPGLAASVTQSAAISFTIRAKDFRRNNITVGGDVFIITSTGPAALSFTIVDNNNGTYTVSYTPTVVGNYTIYIRHRGVDPIQDSPFSITVVAAAGVDASLTTATGDGLDGLIFAGDTYTITIQAKLGSGANKPTGGDTVTAVFTGLAYHTITDHNNGKYTIRYEQVQITTFTITIRINGVQIAGSPFHLESI